jgi:RNA polymerase sigma factor (sigma-70 family)
VAVSATIRAIRQAKARREEALPEAAFEDGSASGGSSKDVPATPPEASPYALAERGELTRTIEAALAALPEPRRLAVGLHLQGLTTREMGELVGWTEPKARNLVYRGLKDLRQSLRALGIEYRG